MSEREIKRLRSTQAGAPAPTAKPAPTGELPRKLAPRPRIGKNDVVFWVGENGTPHPRNGLHNVEYPSGHKEWRSSDGTYLQRPDGLHNVEMAGGVKQWRAPDGKFLQRPDGLHNYESLDGIKLWLAPDRAPHQRNGLHNVEHPSGRKEWRSPDRKLLQRPGGLHNVEYPSGHKEWRSSDGTYLQRPDGLHNLEKAGGVKQWRAPDGAYLQRPDGLHNFEGAGKKRWFAPDEKPLQRPDGSHNVELADGTKSWLAPDGTRLQRPDGLHNEEGPDGTKAWLAPSGEYLVRPDGLHNYEGTAEDPNGSGKIGFRAWLRGKGVYDYRITGMPANYLRNDGQMEWRNGAVTGARYETRVEPNVVRADGTKEIRGYSGQFAQGEYHRRRRYNLELPNGDKYLVALDGTRTKVRKESVELEYRWLCGRIRGQNPALAIAQLTDFLSKFDKRTKRTKTAAVAAEHLKTLQSEAEPLTKACRGDAEP